VSFFVVPSAVALIVLGDVIVAGLYLAGEFSTADVTVVWAVLAAYSLGLLASTSSRVYQSAFFALRDTKTPARVAGVRVLVAAIAGALLMTQFEAITVGSVALPAGVFADLNVSGAPLGPVGLALGAALGAWIEWGLLHRQLRRRVGPVGVGASHHGRALGAALMAAFVAYGLKLALADVHALVTVLLVATAFGLTYFGAARALGLDEARVLLGSMARRIRGRGER
jgi:putative peptidoglycan lipid II flippase